MPAELDTELEDATRAAFARMLGALEVTRPDGVPTTASPRPTPVRFETARQRRRGRLLAAGAAGLVAAAAAAVAVVVLAPDTTGDDVEIGPAGSDEPAPTPTSPPPSGVTPDTDDTDDDPGTGSGTTTVTEAPPPPADGETPTPEGPVELVEGQAVNGPVTLLGSSDGAGELTLQLQAPWLTGFGHEVAGTRVELQRNWLVAAVDNQFVVWGLVSSDIARVTIYTNDSQGEMAETVSAATVGVPLESDGARAFVVVLPELALIRSMSGDRADGSVYLAGTELDTALAEFQQHSPLLREKLAYVPVVVH